MKIVVIGGTGLIGSKLVATLRARGHEVLSASPDSGVNTLTGEGLAPALAGAQVQGAQFHAAAAVVVVRDLLTVRRDSQAHRDGQGDEFLQRQGYGHAGSLTSGRHAICRRCAVRCGS